MSMRRREFLMRTGGVGAGLAVMRHGAAASFPDPDPVGTGPFVEGRRFEPAVYELGRDPWRRSRVGSRPRPGARRRAAGSTTGGGPVAPCVPAAANRLEDFATR